MKGGVFVNNLTAIVWLGLMVAFVVMEAMEQCAQMLSCL
jgi:hypothetical protein